MSLAFGLAPHRRHQLATPTVDHAAAFVEIDDVGPEDGPVVLLLQHGPGLAPSRDLRHLCDVRTLRVIQVSPRGLSPSFPDAVMTGCSLHDALADLEAARCHLQLERWALFGACAGSHLALAYTLAHPSRVSQLGLWSVNLGSSCQTLFAYPHGAIALFPDAWQHALEHLRLFLDPTAREPIVTAIARALQSESPHVLPLAHALGQWASVVVGPRLAATTRQAHDPALWRLHVHYHQHDWFCPPPETWLADNPGSQVPVHFFHGRYDLIHAPRAAHLAHHAWHKSHMTFVPETGYDPTSWAASRELLTWFRRLIPANDQGVGPR